MEQREGYKKTKIGWIPEDWELDKIGNLSKIITGNKDTQNKVDDGEYPFYVRSQKVERINSYSFNSTFGD